MDNHKEERYSVMIILLIAVKFMEENYFTCFAVHGDRRHGHSSRGFDVKFFGEGSSMLASGGWDGVVSIWDTRTSKEVFY